MVFLIRRTTHGVFEWDNCRGGEWGENTGKNNFLDQGCIDYVTSYPTMVRLFLLHKLVSRGLLRSLRSSRKFSN